MSVFAIIVGFMVVVGGLALASAFLPQPTRACPQCEQPVKLTARKCRNCEYRFGPDGSLSRYIR